jgi:hypothetical protein
LSQPETRPPEKRHEAPQKDADKTATSLMEEIAAAKRQVALTEKPGGKTSDREVI